LAYYSGFGLIYNKREIYSEKEVGKRLSKDKGKGGEKDGA
jgi:hypothetical protein